MGHNARERPWHTAPMILAGQATATGTARYFARHTDALELDHIRRLGDLAVGSVGLGSYLGPADDATDARYEGAVARALQSRGRPSPRSRLPMPQRTNSRRRGPWRAR